MAITMISVYSKLKWFLADSYQSTYSSEFFCTCFQVVSLVYFVVVVFLFFFLSLVTLIRQPSELIGVPVHQQENKCPALGKNKTAPATPSLQFTYPLFTMNTCSTAGGANPPQTQVRHYPSITSGTPLISNY